MTEIMRIDGHIIAVENGKADNSSGTESAQINVTLRFEELTRIRNIVSVYATADATINNLSVSGNTLTVTVTVPAGVKSTVSAVVEGY